MFGAADPEQAISQLEAYHREGRGERAEVMASALAVSYTHLTLPTKA